MKRQLDLSIKMTADASNGALATGGCACAFSVAMQLPCCHILAARHHLGLSKFDTSLCAPRWSLEHYMESREMLFMQESRQTDPVHVDRTERQPDLSSHQKSRKASVLVGRIAGVLSEVSTAKFRKRIVVLETLLQHWVNDEEVHLAAEERPLVPREKTGNATGSSDSGALCAFMPVGSKEAAEIPCSTLPSNSAEACASAQDPEIVLSRAQTAIPPTTHQMSNSMQPTEAANCSDCSNPSPAVLSTADVKGIKLAQPMRKCGRPKGHTLTVIGIPRKR